MPNVSFCEDERGVYYNPVHDYSQDYFTMVITSGGNVTWTGTYSSNKLSYSTDDGANWSEASNNITLSVNVGDKVLWKGDTTPGTSYPNQGIGKFSGGTDVRYTVEGNVMSLLFNDNFKGQTGVSRYGLSYLFSGNKNITSAENLSLPATIITHYSYQMMFRDCTSLTTAPSVLPATTLADGCYWSMFNGCISLTTAPELPATTLASMCYYTMFGGCTRLNSIKCLATDISASDCTTDWVKGVASSGTFTKAANMSSWTEGTNGIPSGWTVQDAS